MSHVLISDLLKPCLFLDYVLVIVSLVTLKRLSVPCSHLDVKVIEITVQQDMHFFFQIWSFSFFDQIELRSLFKCFGNG